MRWTALWLLVSVSLHAARQDGQREREGVGVVRKERQREAEGIQREYIKKKKMYSKFTVEKTEREP